MSAVARAREWVGVSDVRLLLAVSIGLYALFTFFSVALGFDLNGTVNTLQRITFLSAVYAMLALALNLQWGYAGLFNIGVAGFMAVGIYTMGMLSASPQASPGGLGLPLPLGILGGVLAAALVGALIAIPALRLKGDYLAIVTLAFAEIIRLSFRSRAMEEFTIAGTTIGTGGADGLTLPADPIRRLFYEEPGSLVSDPSRLGLEYFAGAKMLGIEENVAQGWAYAVLLLIFVALFYWLLVRIGNSPFGRVLKAIREDETVAQALGKDVRLFKIKAFALGAGLMGLASILWFMGEGSFVIADTFEPILTFYVFVALIIGGSGSNTGSVLGGAVFASLLFEGPNFVRRIIDNTFEVGSQPDTIFAAFGSPDALLAYVFSDFNLAALRIVLLGVVLIYLIQRRPEGLLGNRKEIASTVDLSERPQEGDQ